jgi:cytochrome c-type biogenesis protein
VVAFTAGLFSFLSPCVLPLLPSYLSFVTGMSVSDLSGDLTATARRRVMLHSIAFVAGFSVVFVALGASFSAAGAVLLDYRDWIRRIGGMLIIVFGLYIAGLLRIGFLGRSAPSSSSSSAIGRSFLLSSASRAPSWSSSVFSCSRTITWSSTPGRSRSPRTGCSADYDAIEIRV